jgi:protein-disulfide isomerase
MRTGANVVQVIPGEHAKGAPGAALVLEEFGDFGCPYCKRAFPVLASFLRENGTHIRFVYRHFPATEVHPEAELAAEAAEAAAAQEKFWDFHDLIFTRTGELNESLLLGFAERLGLDLRRFSDDLKTHVHRGRVLQDREAGRSRGVRGTPGFYLNGKFVDTSYGLHPLRDALRQGVAQLSDGGTSL